MKKVLLSLVAGFAAIVGLSAQTPFGYYFSSYNNVGYPLSASVENGEKVMYVQALGSSPEEVMMIRVKGEVAISAFNNAMRECQIAYEEKLKDKELKKKDFDEVLDVVFPHVDICFYRNGAWSFDFDRSLKPELINSYGKLHFFLSGGAFDSVNKETSSCCIALKGKRDFRFYFRAIDRNMEKAFKKLAI